MLVSDLENWCLRWLGEDDDSADLAHMPGTSTTPTLTAAAGFVDFYNAVSAEFCRTCFPLANTATYALTSGTRSIRLADFTPAVSPATGEMWALETMKLGSTELLYVSYERMRMQGYGEFSVAAGTPELWTQRGEEVLVAPTPDASGTLTGGGLALPPTSADGTETISWCQLDVITDVMFGIAFRIAASERDDPQMAARAQDALQFYNAARQRRWEQLDIATRAAHYPMPPMPIPAQG